MTVPTRVLGVCVAFAAVLTLLATQSGSAIQPDRAASRSATAASGVDAPATAAPERQLIARSELATTKATLVAIRHGRYAATVRLRVAVLRPAGWTSLGSVRVGEPEHWFWYVVTDRSGVCDVAVGERRHRHIAVRLAVSASIGCAEHTARFVVRGGELVRV